MKNEFVIMFALMAILLGIGGGYLLHEYNDRYQENQSTILINGQVPESRFNYRGLWINIDTETTRNGTRIEINGGHLYRMGIHDGYHGYPINRKYARYPEYQKGYEYGERMRNGSN